MRVEIVLPDQVRASAEVAIRVYLFNDSLEPVAVSRRAFVGPNLRSLEPARGPYPNEVEGSDEEEPLTLQPLCLFGRERRFRLEPGSFEVTAFYNQAPLGRIEAARRFAVEPA